MTRLEFLNLCPAAVRRPAPLVTLLSLFAFTFSAFTIGCDKASSPTDSASGADAVVRSEARRGPVQFTVEISPKQPRLSDEPTLTLTIRAEKGVRVEKPPFGESLGDFLIRDFHEPLPEIDDNVDVIQQVYTLEPTRAGLLSIAPIAVRFHDERDEGDGKEHTIESEALTVEVSTILGDEAPSLADLRPVAGPVELPARTNVGWLWLIMVA
ncbi:MAG: hypothetical protein AAF989_11410, partial [Planctomycetota bacterium]